MSVMKTVLVAGAGIGAGLVVANYLTDGAVFEAASQVFSNAKDSIMNKTTEATEVVVDAAEDFADATETI